VVPRPVSENASLPTTRLTPRRRNASNASASRCERLAKVSFLTWPSSRKVRHKRWLSRSRSLWVRRVGPSARRPLAHAIVRKALGSSRGTRGGLLAECINMMDTVIFRGADGAEDR